MNLAAGEVVTDSSAESCCGTPFAATFRLGVLGGHNLYPPVFM